MNILLEDLCIAARTLWGECRGGNYTGRRAVTHVFFNRLNTSWGQFARDDTLATACLRHVQFSVWNKGDPNFEKMHEVGWGDRDLLECLKIVLEVALGAEDITDGARHYHTKAVEPAWSKDRDPCFETEGHLFFNDVD